MKRICIIGLTVIVFALVVSVLPVAAQEATPVPTSSADRLRELQDRITQLQGKVNDLKAQGQTLSSQITVMDNQMKLTEFRVNATKQELAELEGDISVAEGKVSSLETSLDKISKVLLSRVIATYQVGNIPQMHVLLASSNMENYLTRANYLKLVQAHDKQLLMNTQQAKVDYQNQKDIFQKKKEKVEALNDQLKQYTVQLEQEKTSKLQLLSVTKNDETRYQKLLQEARDQISGFKSFASSKGGSGTIAPQSSADGWYFNQRDERWGGGNIGSSTDPVWQVGCLISSMAMLLKQHGENVTPADIAGNSSYFFANTAYMLIPWGGGRFTSVWSADLGAIDSKLSSGQPVIVGLKAGPYGTHFIVLKSGSGGSYKMHDPWNGPDLNFSDYYSTGQIFQYGYLK
jgi:peptidoglycan hydrolase CwlO-like protein